MVLHIHVGLNAKALELGPELLDSVFKADVVIVLCSDLLEKITNLVLHCRQFRACVVRCISKFLGGLLNCGQAGINCIKFGF